MVEEVARQKALRVRLIRAQLGRRDLSCVAITREELLRAIKNGQSSAPGADGLPYSILNCVAMMDNSPLLDLFNLSYKEGLLPDGWKEAIIIPVPKGRGGHRPISLTYCICKMMERVIVSRLLCLLVTNLSPNLFCFVKSRNTFDCMMKYLTFEGEQCRVFVDLQRCFYLNLLLLVWAARCFSGLPIISRGAARGCGTKAHFLPLNRLPLGHHKGGGA